MCLAGWEGTALIRGSQMFTCTKVYRDVPFAHRQHRHNGNCSFIHGHNWGIGLEFGCKQLDERGFVVDFGGLAYIKTWIDQNLDHACLLAADDPEREALLKSHHKLFKSLIVPSASTEGIAQFLFNILDPMVRKESQGRAWLIAVHLYEDSKNSARYQPDV